MQSNILANLVAVVVAKINCFCRQKFSQQVLYLTMGNRHLQICKQMLAGLSLFALPVNYVGHDEPLKSSTLTHEIVKPHQGVADSDIHIHRRSQMH